MRCRTVFHSAINDPTTRDDAPPRYTIECAVAAEFEYEEDKPSRVARFLSQIDSTYPDGTQSTWGTGEPIKGYVPPAGAATTSTTAAAQAEAEEAQASTAARL